MGIRLSRITWQFIAVFLVAVNMRMTISGIGPLLEDIAASRGASAAALGMLASIPLLTWAVVSPLAHGIAARIGMDRTITWSLLLLGAGTVWRSLSFAPANLWLGTALVGATLAVANVLMPAIVKRDFGKRTPAMMGVYSAALGGAAGVGTAIAIPIARAEIGGVPLGWEAGLAASGIAIPFALVAWVLVTRMSKRQLREGGGSTTAIPSPTLAEGPATNHGRRVWASKTAWLLALYMGTQSATFYILATWIVPMELSFGFSEARASTWITVFHTCGMIGSLLAPVLLRFDGRLLLQVAIPATQIITMTAFVFVPSLTPLWLIVLGLCCGASLSVSLTLIAQRSTDTITATAVSGMSQSIGYLIASFGPVLFGFTHDLTGGWILPLGVLVFGLATQFVVGWILRDGRTVRL